MLPDFLEFKRHFRLALEHLVTTQAKSGPLLSIMRGGAHYEGSKHLTAGDSTERPYEEAEALFTMANRDIAEGGPEAVLAKAVETGVEMRKQVEKHAMQMFQEAARRGAAGFTMGEGPITPESVLDALEKAEFSFDSAGRHRCAVAIGPGALKAWRECEREIAENPEYAQRLRDIIERKHREWLSRRSAAGLAD